MQEGCEAILDEKIAGRSSVSIALVLETLGITQSIMAMLKQVRMILNLICPLMLRIFHLVITTYVHQESHMLSRQSSLTVRTRLSEHNGLLNCLDACIYGAQINSRDETGIGSGGVRTTTRLVNRGAMSYLVVLQFALASQVSALGTGL